MAVGSRRLLVARGAASCVRPAAVLGQRRLFGYKVSKDAADVTGRIGNAHRSESQSFVSQVPVAEIDGHTAICEGGGGSLGHPVEYIELNPDEPSTCLYCGYKYIQKRH